MSTPERAPTSGSTPGELKRVLGPVDATCVVIGAIIGVGIFFTPQEVARTAGNERTAMLIWSLGGAVAMLGALTFAELGRMYPRAGGQYDILRDTWGAPCGFLYVFCNLTAMQTGSVAVIGIICADNLAVAVGAEHVSGTYTIVMGLILAWGIAFANAVGVRQGATVQNLTVYAKVATLLAVTALAMVTDGPVEDVRHGGAATPSALLAGLLPALFSYGGWQQALWMGGEVRDAEKNLPRAIILGVIIVIASYLAASWAYFRLLGFEGVVGAHALAADAVARAWPGVGRRAVAFAVALSAFGVLNAQFLTGPRLTWALANDGRFFRSFARIHPTAGTPVAAVLLLAGLSSAILLFAGADGVGALTAWVVVVDALFFALTGLSLLRLRLKQGIRSARLVVPLAFAALELGAVVGAVLEPTVRAAALIGLAWVGAAFGCYVLFFRGKKPA